MYACVSHLHSEALAKDRIPVPQQVTWGLVKGKCLSQLLSRPPRGRMTDHVEVENATTITGQHQKHFPGLRGTGNTYISQNDLTIPGIGGGLKLMRSWNSLWPTSQLAFSAGLFGNNWRSNYEERVFLGNDGTMKYSRSDGSFWSFLLYGSPAIYHVIAPANRQATMTEQGTTSWTITFQNGEQRLFNYNSGWLTNISDRNGNQTFLAYDSLSRLTSVTDPASRHLYFSYTSPSSYLISAVTSDVGLSLSYVYDSQSRLATVAKPDQTTISFTYDSNSFITAVKDQMGKILESHTYDSTGRGLTSSKANGVEFVTVSYGNQ